MSQRAHDKSKRNKKPLHGEQRKLNAASELVPVTVEEDTRNDAEPLPPNNLRNAWNFHRVPIMIAAGLTAALYLFLFFWVRV